MLHDRPQQLKQTIEVGSISFIIVILSCTLWADFQKCEQMRGKRESQHLD